MRDKDIAQAFIGTSVQAVVLSACESSMVASTELNNGLAAQLSSLGIPHVIGMRESILDRAGIQLAHALCGRLAQQERIDIALQAARAAITKPLAGVSRRDTELTGASELSLGQWCLPMLQSPAPEKPLLDWDFERQPRRVEQTNQSLNTISLPPRFIGRRFKLRTLATQLRERKQLLITGPGGQGKTALAGKLAQDLQQQQGYEVLAWSARPENKWAEFVFEIELLLNEQHAQQFDRMRPRFTSEEAKAELLLRFMMVLTQNRLVLFFDNLESLQDPDSHEVQNETVSAWIRAAQSHTDDGLMLLLTSRWLLPGWPETDHETLARVSYGDFLALAGQIELPRRLFQQPERMRQVYTTLHGNARGLEIFAAAVAEMGSEDEAEFLQKLSQAQIETQIDMALDTIIGHLDAEARTSLEHLPVYQVPIPFEGLRKIALDLPAPEDSLQKLLAVSLVERQYDHRWQVYQYQLPALVVDWLARHQNMTIRPELSVLAAEYQMYLFKYERRILPQAQVVHGSMLRAKLHDQADRFALDYIVGPLNRAGLFQTLLDDWLPLICNSKDLTIRSEGLGQTGKQLLHIGDYDTALDFLKQSLAIRQEIGDKAGEGATLNNISQIFKARGDYDTALDFLNVAQPGIPQRAI